MGNCFSSNNTPQPNQQSNAPASYAAALASTALNAAADYLAQPDQQNGGQTGAPPTASSGDEIANAYVTKMPDGDTVTVSYTDASGASCTTRVRIMGIDCPETAQNFGKEAGDIGRAILLNKNITLHVHTTDRYGRIVADVTSPDGSDYAQYMLRQGAAWHYKAYDKRQELADLEEEARANGIGLWSYARPQPPWDYRRRRREAQGRD